MAEPPPVRYAQSGDVDIAYQVLGEGPPDIVVVAGFITHLTALWEDPELPRVVRAAGLDSPA